MDRLGRYEILEELGRGAMGTVYRARDPKIGRIVAIKTILSSGITEAQDLEFRRRFVREAQAAGNLSHPGIVTIYDVGEDESTQTPYIVMEYIAGRTLEDYAPELATQIPRVLDLVEQMAEALDYAHAQNIVHRDIKPPNIIINPEGRAKITDFGVAKLTHTEYTMQGQLVGTPAYMSPEQLKGEPMDGRSDLFSLGVILYRLLGGEKPFSGDPVTVIAKILYQDPAPVSNCNPELGSEFDAVVSRAIAKDPAARFQRGKELAEELSRLRRGKAWQGESSLASGTVQREAPIGIQRETPTGDSGAKLSRGPASRTNAATAVLEKTAILTASPGSDANEFTPTQAGYWKYAKRSLIYATTAVSVGVLLFWLAPMMQRVKTSRRAHAQVTSPIVRQPEPAAETRAPAIEGPVRDVEKPYRLDKTGEPDKASKSDKPARAPAPPLALRHVKTAASANLQILCWYDFESAELSIWADDNLVYERQLKAAKNRMSSYLSETVRVPAGRRRLRVRIKSIHAGYDRSKTIVASFTEGREKTLEITGYELEKDLRLAWQDHAH